MEGSGGGSGGGPRKLRRILPPPLGETERELSPVRRSRPTRLHALASVYLHLSLSLYYRYIYRAGSAIHTYIYVHIHTDYIRAAIHECAIGAGKGYIHISGGSVWISIECAVCFSPSREGERERDARGLSSLSLALPPAGT